VGQFPVAAKPMATAWFRKAAEQGNADAQLSLGVKCEFGLGVEQDYAQAVVWFCYVDAPCNLSGDGA